MNTVEQRGPLFDAVKKHATSRPLKTVIVCNFIALGGMALLLGTLCDFFISLSDVFPISLKNATPFYPYICLVVIALIAILFEFVYSIILTFKYIEIRKFFNGKSESRKALTDIIKLQKLYYVFVSVEMVVSIIAVIATSFTSIYSAAEVNAILPSLIIAGPIYLAEVGGMVVFNYFSYKSIKQTLECAENAIQGKPEGKVSVFTQVLSVIGIVSAASMLLSALYIIILLVVAFSALMMADSIFFSVLYSSIFAVFFLIAKALWPLIIVAVPTLIASISYVKLIFGFKKDMELAKLEHTELERARSEALASALTTDADDTSETVDTDSDSQSTEDNGDSV